MRLDNYLSNFFIREVHHFAVRTSPAETYRAACDLDMAKIPWIRTLFRVRTLLGRADEDFSRLTLRDAYKNGGFHRLKEVADQELIVGAIGKIWRPALEFEQFEPEQFNSFHKSGFGKVAWSLRCEPRLYGSGTLGTFEIRVGATDAFSCAKMRSYYSMIGPFSRSIRRWTLSRLTQQLGDCYSDEATRLLPGDEIIENPAGSLTHAITIEATPENIWSWLVQMGCLRGGWYSYDWLDNGGIPSASHILPNFQDLKERDALPATPQANSVFLVMKMEPFHALVFGGCYDLDSNETVAPDANSLPQNYWRVTWTFILEPQTREVTRLIVRARVDFRGPSKKSLYLRAKIMPYVHYLMQRKQLQNLKRRAETMQRTVTIHNKIEPA
jgi:hypothetical protein